MLAAWCNITDSHWFLCLCQVNHVGQSSSSLLVPQSHWSGLLLRQTAKYPATWSVMAFLKLTLLTTLRRVMTGRQHHVRWHSWSLKQSTTSLLPKRTKSAVDLCRSSLNVSSPTNNLVSEVWLVMWHFASRCTLIFISALFVPNNDDAVYTNKGTTNYSSPVNLLICTRYYTITPLHALVGRLNNFSSTCRDFSLNLVIDRLVTWLLQSVMYVLPLNTRLSPTFDTFKSNAVWKLTFSNIRSTPLPCCPSSDCQRLWFSITL